MHLTRVILEYVRRSIANNNLLKNWNKPKELFSKEKKMDKWQTDVWHRGKHHWWSKPQSDELSSRWVASGRGDRNVSNFRGEREEECEWVAPHADSLRTKLHDCHVIQQLHWYIPKSKKVPVLEKSSGLVSTLTHGVPSHPLSHHHGLSRLSLNRYNQKPEKQQQSQHGVPQPQAAGLESSQE